MVGVTSSNACGEWSTFLEAARNNVCSTRKSNHPDIDIHDKDYCFMQLDNLYLLESSRVLLAVDDDLIFPLLG